MKTILKFLASVALLCGSTSAAERPNIVVVLIDDMGWGDFSCFGNKDAQTPNVDRLAAEGIRFSQFYVNSPICSPSRTALTTGQYPQRRKITSFLNNRADNARRGVADWLDPKAPTLARMLQQNGYATGHFGKWHMGGQRDVDDAPAILDYGFDESLTNFEGMGAKLLPLTMKPGATEPGKIWADAERLGKPVTWMQRSQITSAYINAAIPFIDKAAAAKKPFFVNLWPDDVHSPFWPPVDKWADGKRGLYRAVLTEADRQLGKLFDHIRSTPALRDNTIVLVFSDNGPEPGAGSAGPFRGTKGTLYEGGTRSSLIAWAPGLMDKSKAGKHNEQSVFAAFDLAPSLLSIAKVTPPAGVVFDGENLAPVLLGESTASRKAPIFWRRPPDRKTMPPSPELLPALSVRDGDWKLLCEYDGSEPQLYDLGADRTETKNVAAQNPDQVARLTKALLAWHTSMPPDNGPTLAEAPGKPGHESRMWDRAVMPQPFEKAPFREVRIPEWVRNTIGAGYTLSGMTTAQRERAVAAGITISEFGFVDPFYAYYDSKLLKRRSPHVPLEKLDQEMAEYRRLGVRILGVYPPCLQGEVYADHPEWRRIATNTLEIPTIDLKKFPHGGMLCLLGPYGDFFIDVLAEIVTRYPAVSAFSFDGLHYGGVCYCGSCRDDFKKDTGGEIPNVSMDDPAFRRYQHWADRRMESLVQRMQTRLKGINPELALVTWTTNAGRFGHFRDIPRNMPARMNLLFDAPDQEFWMDETNRGGSIVPAFGNAYAWAVTNHRVAFSEPYLMSHGNPYGKESFPAHEIERRMMLVLTHGAMPSLAVSQPKFMQDAVYKTIGEVQKRKPWLTDKAPEPWAALVMSDNTRVFYGRDPGRVEERYLANVFGFFRAGVEEHLPITIINDWNLTADDLAKYKVLILPNTACLDDAQCTAIRQFVERGGGLVASLDASLCNEFGDRREDFGLADVFGANYRGVPGTVAGKAEMDVNFARNLGADYWEKSKGVWDFRRAPEFVLGSPRLHGLTGNETLTFKGQAVQVAPKDGADLIGTLALKSGEKAEPVPAILTHTFGKGRVVYFSAGFDAAHYLYSYPWYRVLLRNAIDWVAPAPAPITVEAPMCVHVVPMRQVKAGERLLVHLYNDVNTTANHARPDDDVPLREETLPIHDIRVTFHGYKIGRVHLEPSGNELEKQTQGEAISVVVPRLDIHTMIIAELVQ